MRKSKKTIKSLKTIEETTRGRNIKTVDKTTKKVSKNTALIEETKKGKHPGYQVVKPKMKPEYLRSLKNKKKIDNLDPKIKTPKKK